MKGDLRLSLVVQEKRDVIVKKLTMILSTIQQADQAIGHRSLTSKSKHDHLTLLLAALQKFADIDYILSEFIEEHKCQINACDDEYPVRGQQEQQQQQQQQHYSGGFKSDVSNHNWNPFDLHRDNSNYARGPPTTLPPPPPPRAAPIKIQSTDDQLVLATPPILPARPNISLVDVVAEQHELSVLEPRPVRPLVTAGGDEAEEEQPIDSLESISSSSLPYLSPECKSPPPSNSKSKVTVKKSPNSKLKTVPSRAHSVASICLNNTDDAAKFLDNSLFESLKSSSKSGSGGGGCTSNLIRPQNVILEVVELRRNDNKRNNSDNSVKNSTRMSGKSAESASKLRLDTNCGHSSRQELIKNSICVFSEIVSPSEFYLHNDPDYVNQLQLQLNEEKLKEDNIANLYKHKAVARTFLGNNCLIYDVDQWYRGEVLDWLLDDMIEESENVHVQLIDFGRKLLCNYNKLVPMTEFFAQFPKLAIQCHLAKLSAPSSTSTIHLSDWPKCSIDLLRNIAGVSLVANERPKFSVVLVESVSNVVANDVECESYGVDLKCIVPNNHLIGDQTVAQYLIKENCAVYFTSTSGSSNLSADNNSSRNRIRHPAAITTIDNDAKKKNKKKKKKRKAEEKSVAANEKQGKPVDNSNTIADLSLSEFELNLDDENVNELVTGYDGTDVARVCPHTDATGKGCFKGRRCQLEHRLLPTDGITTDTQLISCGSFKIMELPRHNEEVLILVTGYISICRYYVQFVKTPKGLYDAKLQNLYERMNHPKAIRNYQHFKRVNPSAGEIVITLWNNEWHRGTFLGFKTSCMDVANVFLVDYGQEYMVSVKDLREMQDQFLDLPFQAIECELCDVQPKPGNDVKAKTFWENHIQLNHFVAQILDYSMPLSVKMKKMNQEDLSLSLTHFGLITSITNGEGKQYD